MMKNTDPDHLFCFQSSPQNLMCIPPSYIRALKAKIQAASTSPEHPPALLTVSQIELSFLLAKESVAAWAESLKRSTEQKMSVSMKYTLVQVNWLNWVRIRTLLKAMHLLFF